MNYDEYVSFCKYLSHDKNVTLRSLAVLLGRQEKETLPLILQLRHCGCPLEITQNQLVTLLRPVDVYLKQQIVTKLTFELKAIDIVLSIFISVDSTNSYLKSLTIEADQLLICLTEHQTEGRGRRGKLWISPFASNIYLSIRKVIFISPRESGCTSLIVGLAIIKALESYGYSGLQLKWPNDIYFQGKKLAGVLIEVVSIKPDHIDMVVGIGLNINMPHDASTDIGQPWVDLSQITPNEMPSRNQIVIALINRINSNLALFEVKGFACFLEEWKQYDYLAGKAITAKQELNEVHGIAIGINSQGELLVKGEGGILTVNSGEVSVRLFSSLN